MPNIPNNDAPPNPPSREGKRRRTSGGGLILRSTAVLPAMFTIFNGLSGFAAIHFATKHPADQTQLLGNLSLAAWLIFLAMVFDTLDGRVARLTRRTSDFGGQLDSLCDMISFGVAPAVLVLQTILRALDGQIERIGFLPDYLIIERIAWCVAGAYVTCTALRLARFNVENEPDKSAHMDFRGLPSPGAAAAVAALVLLFGRLPHIDEGWRSATWFLLAVGITLPIVTLAAALLMVSRFKYPHLANQYVRGKRPFSYIVKLLVIVLVAVLEPYLAAALATTAYALSGPMGWLGRMARRKTPAGPNADEDTSAT